MAIGYVSHACRQKFCGDCKHGSCACSCHSPVVTYRLHIYIPSCRRWECHESSTAVLRDRIRAIWRAAGHATAVER
jgi:hypothetical protein